MKTIAEIIARTGGLAKLRDRPLRIESSGYMALCIEYLGPSPFGEGLVLISVAHYGELNGDLMRDPDVVFNVDASDHKRFGWRTGNWRPVSFRNDYAGVFREALILNAAGRVTVNMPVSADLIKFAEMWDKNLRDQGFLDAAKREEEGA